MSPKKKGAGSLFNLNCEAKSNYKSYNEPMLLTTLDFTNFWDSFTGIGGVSPVRADQRVFLGGIKTLSCFISVSSKRELGYIR